MSRQIGDDFYSLSIIQHAKYITVKATNMMEKQELSLRIECTTVVQYEEACELLERVDVMRLGSNTLLVLK